jgi:hypothetical protein
VLLFEKLVILVMVSRSHTQSNLIDNISKGNPPLEREIIQACLKGGFFHIQLDLESDSESDWESDSPRSDLRAN